MNYTSDTDTFQTRLLKGLTYTIEVRGADSGSGSLGDPYLIYHDKLSDPTDNDGGTGRDARLTITKTTATSIDFLDVRANPEVSGSDATTGSYRVLVSEGRGTNLSETIQGFFSADAINGMGGDDTIRGAESNDVIRGGAGADVLIGDGGNDIFRFGLTSESVGTGRDRIIAGSRTVAFEHPGAASGDRIDLSAIDADTRTAGNQTFIFGGSGAGHVTLTTSRSDTIVHGNTDGDAAYEFDLLIADHTVTAASYTAADCIL